MAKRQVVVANGSVDNGHAGIPAVLYNVVTVSKENLNDTVVKDGFLKADDIYRGLK